MRVLILLSLIFPLAARPLARTVSARVEPRLGTWLMTGAALLLAGTSCGALGLLVLSPLVRMPWAARLGHWSSTIVADAGLPGGWTSLGAALALGVALGAVVAFAVRRGRALAEARRHARALPGPGQLVVTRDTAAYAFAIPGRSAGGAFDMLGNAAADANGVTGRPGRIVVSAGMLEVLDERGRAALLAHERTHLTGRHHWFTGVARLAASANPLVRPLASAVEYSVERWADESAAAVVGDRQVVARAIATAAIAVKVTSGGVSAARLGALGITGTETRSRGARRLMSGAARIFTGDDGGLAGAGPVPRRVAALLGPAPTTRRSVPVLAISLFFLGIAALCALQAADHLQDLISIAHDARID